jgi:Sec-independent protein translocase protein TatA
MGGVDWPIVVLLVFVLLAASQLPRLARGLGEEQRDIKHLPEETEA